ncbi:MAG: hypothetical protein U5K69_19520 [Balneolaceae bacterium]|nr:hypothetical protein [Balneolaceae bacterium]
MSHIFICSIFLHFREIFEELLNGYENVLIPEINNGQLVRLVRSEFQIKATGINKIKGRPFGVEELKQEIISALKVNA